jgi:hypothetical protein
MWTLLSYIAAALAFFWVVHDPTGAANTVAHVAHQMGVAASALAQHLSTQKPALPGVSPGNDQGEG